MQSSQGAVQTWGWQGLGVTIKTQFSPDALLLKRFFGVPQDCRRQERPICDSEPPRLNRVPTFLERYGVPIVP